MEYESTNLFFTFLRLKSYLVSLMDESKQNYKDFHYTEEYLSRRYPDEKTSIIRILEDNGIFNDADIAFNEKVIMQFRKIANESKAHTSLVDLLTKLEIEVKDFTSKDKERSKYISLREERLNSILEILFQLATNWSVLRELEDKVDSYSVLNDEEVIRPDEEKNLDALDSTTSQAFNIISDLTKQYIKRLTDYYFEYGGDISLKAFVEELDITKNEVNKKYFELFKKHGLDTDWLEKGKNG